MADFRRKTNRLSSELYQGQYWYFITVCTKDQKVIFPLPTVDENGEEQCGDTEVAATELKDLVEECLFGLQAVYPSFCMDQYVIMPNHIHAIMSFDEGNSLGQVMKSFKGYSQRTIIKATERSPQLQEWFHQKNFNYHTFWQKSYYDRIIRNDQDYERIRKYIYDNPAQWRLDSLHPDNVNA